MKTSQTLAERVLLICSLLFAIAAVTTALASELHVAVDAVDKARVERLLREKAELNARGGKRLMSPEVRERLRHKDVKTTIVYTHVLNRGGQGVRRSADAL